MTSIPIPIATYPTFGGSEDTEVRGFKVAAFPRLRQIVDVHEN
jgi:hypothetical protein